MNPSGIVSFLGGVADLIRDSFKRGKCQADLLSFVPGPCLSLPIRRFYGRPFEDLDGHIREVVHMDQGASNSKNICLFIKFLVIIITVMRRVLISWIGHAEVPRSWGRASWGGVGCTGPDGTRLAAQALALDLPLVSVETLFYRYGVNRIWQCRPIDEY